MADLVTDPRLITGNKYKVVTSHRPLVKVYTGHVWHEDFIKKHSYIYYKVRRLCYGDIVRIIGYSPTPYTLWTLVTVYCTNRNFSFQLRGNDLLATGAYQWIDGPDNVNKIWRELNDI